MFEYYSLSPEQEKASRAPEKTVLCLAGAGSGKTRVLIARILFYREQNIDPQSIACFTFTRKAANEMKDRLAGQVGEQIAGLITVKTFHSFCLSILNRFGHFLGYDQLTIFDQQDREDIIENIKLNLVSKSLQKRDIEEAFKLYDSKGIISKGEAGKLLLLYLAKMREWKAVDFGMIVNEALRLLRINERVLGYYKNRFQYLLIDEFQDTDLNQKYLIELIAPENLFVVGDDYQSIFGWRNSDVDLIINFERHFKPASFGVYSLERNYRSTKDIVDLSEKIIRKNSSQVVKNCYSERDGEPVSFLRFDDVHHEAQVLSEKVLAYNRKGIPFNQMAILYRKHCLGETISSLFQSLKIPVIQTKPEDGFWDSQDVRAIISILYAMSTQNEYCLFRAINYPEQTMKLFEFNLVSLRATKRGTSTYNYLKKYAEPGRAKTFIGLLEMISSAPDVLAIFDQIVDLFGFTTYFKERWLTSRLQRILKFREYIIQWQNSRWKETGRLIGFLEWLRLKDMQIAYETEEKQDGVNLLTIHTAKGLEWKIVFVIGLEDNNLPVLRDINNIQEERRLFYVAVTRAMDALNISSVPGRYNYRNQISRFILEVL